MLSPEKPPSWQGICGNLSYKEIKDDVYEYNYTDLSAKNYELWVQGKVSRLEDVFILPHGFCKVYPDMKLDMANWFLSKTKIKVLLIDPNKSTKLRALENPENTVHIGPSGT